MARTVCQLGTDETTSDELLSILDDDREVRLETDSAIPGRTVTLRKRDGTYYCDTSVKLYTHESDQSLLSRLESLGVFTTTDRS